MSRNRLEKFLPIYAAGRRLFRVFFRTLYAEREVGQRNVPTTGPVIVAANHVSFLDPPLVGGAITTRQVWFMAKKELFQIPILGRLIGYCGCFFVDRKARDGKAIDRGLQLLNSGKLIGIFPEGTRSRDGKLKQGKAGVAMLALKTGATIVPAAVFNSKEIVDRKFLPGPPLGIRIGEPISVEKMEEPSRERIREVLNQVMGAIAALQEKGLPTLEEVAEERAWAATANATDKNSR